MRLMLLTLALATVTLAGCQSDRSGAHNLTPQTLTAADYKHAKPLTAEEEEKLLAIGERQKRLAPLNIASSFDPTGLSQHAVQARSSADMAELNRMMPAMQATAKKRAEEFCSTRRQTAECLEFEKLTAQARLAGLDY